jgi:hypothetical protein
MSQTNPFKFIKYREQKDGRRYKPTGWTSWFQECQDLTINMHHVGLRISSLKARKEYHFQRSEDETPYYGNLSHTNFDFLNYDGNQDPTESTECYTGIAEFINPIFLASPLNHRDIKMRPCLRPIVRIQESQDKQGIRGSETFKGGRYFGLMHFDENMVPNFSFSLAPSFFSTVMSHLENESSAAIDIIIALEIWAQTIGDTTWGLERFIVPKYVVTETSSYCQTLEFGIATFRLIRRIGD